VKSSAGSLPPGSAVAWTSDKSCRSASTLDTDPDSDTNCRDSAREKASFLVVEFLVCQEP
jgi:hypothetical protein